MATSKFDLVQIVKDAKKNGYHINSAGNLQNGNSVISISPSGGSVNEGGYKYTTLHDFKNRK